MFINDLLISKINKKPSFDECEEKCFSVYSSNIKMRKVIANWIYIELRRVSKD
jgi:hypothetical protein